MSALFGVDFNPADPFAFGHSVNAVFTMAVSSYGDSYGETKTLIKDFFQLAQKYSGDDAERFWVEKWQDFYDLLCLITLDKKAGQIACGTGGGGPDAKFWDHSSAHKSREKGMKQAYICPSCKRAHKDAACCHVWVLCCFVLYCIILYCIVLYYYYSLLIRTPATHYYYAFLLK